MFKNCIIMAAGTGTRMKPLTDVVPKAMAPFKKSTLIKNRIDSLRDIKNIHVTVGYKKNLLSEYLISQNISTIIDTENKGNSWWIFNSFMQHIDEPVIVFTCDNIATIKLNQIYEDYINLGNPLCMVLPAQPIDGIDGDYIELGSKNKVLSLSRTAENTTYCSGIQILNPKKIKSVVKECDDFSVLWKNLINLGELFSSNIILKDWRSVDDLEQLRIANEQS